jgi:hypothetical protein
MALGTGCSSGRVPVTGTVKYPDGSPLEGGTVIAEAKIEDKNVTVQANVEADGSFELGGIQAGDGAFPGKYRAVVMPVALGDADLAAGKTPSVEGKYTRFESSGIEFEVTQGPNVVNITVTKPKSK